MKLSSFILSLFLLSIVLNAYCQQSDNNEPIFEKRKNNIGKTKLELAILGIGIERMYQVDKYSLGWGISARYLNIVIAANTSLTNGKTGLDTRFDWDYLRAKFIYRKVLLNYFELDISPFATFSFSQLTEEYYPAFGLELGLFFFRIGRLKISTAVTVKKSIVTRDLYFTSIPIKLKFLSK